MDKKLTIDSVKGFETEVDYTTVLEVFEGPLDLLLHLIKEQRIEIKDIFVSQVTEQFLSYMKGLPYIDVDKASEYLHIASLIIEIKAKSLIPPPDDEYAEYYDEWDEDPKEELIRALEERKMILEETEKLKELETVGYYFKEPDSDLNKAHVIYKELTVDKMIEAFTQMMLKRESAKKTSGGHRKIPKDPFTVKDKIKYIRTKLKAKDSSTFDELFEEDTTVPEVVATFQALLELLKHQFLFVEQDELFSTITIKKNPNISEDEEIGEIDEYH